MEPVHYIMFAGIAAWTGIGLYLFFLSKKQIALATRLRQLELLEDTRHE